MWRAPLSASFSLRNGALHRRQRAGRPPDSTTAAPRTRFLDSGGRAAAARRYDLRVNGEPRRPGAEPSRSAADSSRTTPEPCPLEAEPYLPAPEVLSRLSQVDFVAVVGPSAAGKTTLIHEAAARSSGIRPVLNNTSRGPRPGEVGGVDFRFETRSRMLDRIASREYVQVAPTVFGDLYATAAEDYATDAVAVLPVLADAVPAFRALPFRSLRVIYVLPPDWPTWQYRMTARHTATDQLRRRLEEGRRSLEYALDEPDLRFVVSDELEAATADFIDAVLDSPGDGGPQREAAVAPRDLVELLLKRAEGWLADLSLGVEA